MTQLRCRFTDSRGRCPRSTRKDVGRGAAEKTLPPSPPPPRPNHRPDRLPPTQGWASLGGRPQLDHRYHVRIRPGGVVHALLPHRSGREGDGRGAAPNTTHPVETRAVPTHDGVARYARRTGRPVAGRESTRGNQATRVALGEHVRHVWTLTEWLLHCPILSFPG